MMNQSMLVGRLIEKPEIIEDENGTKKCIITLAVNRAFKNADGVYETDFIKCLLWNNIAQNVCEYCIKGDLVGVRGRLRQGIENKELELVADKITFLSSAKKEDENE